MGLTVMVLAVLPLLQVCEVPPVTVRFTGSPGQMDVSLLMVVAT